MKKILIAEDEFITSNELRTLLTKLGYTKIETAFDGAEIIEKVETYRPDLVLMDINLGRGVGENTIDGIDISSIIQLNHNIPIIYITAYADKNTLERAKLTKPYAYILKPFEERELSIAIEIALYKHETERKLEDANKQLKKTNQVKDKLFSIIAHDLKSPFSGLLGVSQALKDNYSNTSPEELLKSATIIHNTVNHTYNLLENLLTWSRIQIDKLPFDPKKYKIKPIVQDVLMLARYSGADKKNIKVEMEIKPEELEVYIDKDMVQTVYRNLVSNAVKYTESGKKITIGSIYHEHHDKVLCFVKDEGIGISENTKKKIFKVENHFSTKGLEGERGTGLGLVLCQEFVEKNGGEIWVESSEGKGSIFYFTLNKA